MNISYYWERLLNKSLKDVVGTTTSVKTEEKVAALTFDDGPHPSNTPQLLDLLEEFNAKATFFVIGEFAQEHPLIIDRIVSEGHELGNHTWSHKDLPKMTLGKVYKEIQSSSSVINTSYFRPPFGHQNIRTSLIAKVLGYKIVTWNFHLEDWENRDSKWMFQKFKKNICPGSIVLLHDRTFEKEIINDDKTSLFEVLNKIFTTIDDYNFITVSELLKDRIENNKLWIK
ncbi:polysaccharide deacetylase family protein [Aliifodinibius salicampi]|uniref:Polysaccharide deacetylase family protein n=1 Tax=Fodinibius salicampi TaxID=1920655 RepID=A0ABT3PV71_9BACT|nr:polysaccharide deacetylase family protein [Fodinibius salicampi]MCW9711742.1 polysaccharide deacetylase family protein [Fodinibius salicampi]